MSTTDEEGLKIFLERTGADEFWQVVHTHFAEADTLQWKYLAMLALRENAGWTLERIGYVFDHKKGHVTRCLRKIKTELKAQFQMSPEWLEMTDDDPATPSPNQSHTPTKTTNSC